ncbi:hypothetical protein TWF694_003580 [Orbilia ellipsospora]|uniref:Uncharacterized protein n=1 Tax=Orbilia ellipsospora TaxID=2528407 RepID=A0AAV9WZH4_9PEZI
MPPVHSQPPKSLNLAQKPSYSSSTVLKCCALYEDGSDCQRNVFRPEVAGHTFCVDHHHEFRDLYQSYKDKHAKFNQIKADAGTNPKRKLVVKLIGLGKEVLLLRNQVKDGFFSSSLPQNDRAHIREILKLAGEVRNLENKINEGPECDQTAKLATAREISSQDTEVKRADTQAKKEVTMEQPLLDPTVPMTKPRHLRHDHPAVVVKDRSIRYTKLAIKQLYAIVPSLDDSLPPVPDERIGNTGMKTKLETRDIIIQFVFREFLIYKADTRELSRATRAQTIDSFLQESFIDDIKEYIEFFGAFFGRLKDKFWFLRNAVCDFLLDSQPSSATTCILGAEILMKDRPREMTVEGWDLLFQHFYDIIGWDHLGNFAFQFEDFLTVSALIACQRYGEPNRDDLDSPNWYYPHQDTGQECSLAVFHRFMAVTRSFNDHVTPPIEVKDGIIRETQSRSYLVGRMSKGDTFALRLAEELNERVARLQVLLYDRDLKSANREHIPPYTADGLTGAWITRSRTASTEKQLKSQPWTIEWSLDGIFSQIRSIDIYRYQKMTRDYYEFIIIDRDPGMTFNLLGIVVDALQKLNGDPPFSKIFGQVIQKYIPADDQNDYLEVTEAIADDFIPQAFPSQYINNRVRCWNGAEPFLATLEKTRQDMFRSSYPYESRLISKMVTDLESNEIITRVSEYEPPSTVPIVLRGSDGYEDIYFYYKLKASTERNDPNFNFSRSNLFEFAKAYKRDHPDAVFTKGRINVYYCAWPIPVPKHLQYSNFRTPEGRIYKWKALSFDLPMASRYWQWTVNNEINDKLPFVCLVDTTLVVCAEDYGSVNANIKTLFDIGKKFGWSFSIPSSLLWTTDFRRLGLETLWEGVRPDVTQFVDRDTVE